MKRRYAVIGLALVVGFSTISPALGGPSPVAEVAGGVKDLAKKALGKSKKANKKARKAKRKAKRSKLLAKQNAELIAQLEATPGPKGEKGDTGPQGEQGPAGSPDTPEQVRDKLSQVDGSGSGIDADQLDGIDSGGLVLEVHSDTVTFDPPSLAAGACAAKSVSRPGTVRDTDTLVVSPTSVSSTPYFQVAPMLHGNALYAFMCNNGPTAWDQDSTTFNFRVLR